MTAEYHGDFHGAVWWTELLTRDVAAAVAYYGATCGWSFETVPMGEAGDYTLGIRDGVPIVGIMDMTGLPGMDQLPAHWFSYFAVRDVDAVVASVAEAGGKVIRSPFEVPQTGRIAIIEDPSGAPVGMMTPDATALSGG